MAAGRAELPLLQTCDGPQVAVQLQAASPAAHSVRALLPQVELEEPAAGHTSLLWGLG